MDVYIVKWLPQLTRPPPHMFTFRVYVVRMLQIYLHIQYNLIDPQNPFIL